MILFILCSRRILCCLILVGLLGCQSAKVDTNLPSEAELREDLSLVASEGNDVAWVIRYFEENNFNWAAFGEGGKVLLDSRALAKAVPLSSLELRRIRFIQGSILIQSDKKYYMKALSLRCRVDSWGVIHDIEVQLSYSGL